LAEDREIDLRGRAYRGWINVADFAGVAVLDGRRLGPHFDLDDTNEFVAALRQSATVVA
jgi:hypothetical protein